MLKITTIIVPPSSTGVPGVWTLDFDDADFCLFPPSRRDGGIGKHVVKSFRTEFTEFIQRPSFDVGGSFSLLACWNHRRSVVMEHKVPVEGHAQIKFDAVCMDHGFAKGGE